MIFRCHPYFFFGPMPREELARAIADRFTDAISRRQSCSSISCTLGDVELSAAEVARPTTDASQRGERPRDRTVNGLHVLTAHIPTSPGEMGRASARKKARRMPGQDAAAWRRPQKPVAALRER